MTDIGSVSPRTPYESAVAAIWCDVLGRPEISVLDDFFDLGGHSLLAVRVAVRIRKTLGVQVPVEDIFESRTVAGLAALIATADGRSPSRPEITPRPPDAEPVLSFDQQRLWLESQLRPASAYNVHGCRCLLGDLHVAALERSIRAILARHEALRTRFPLVDGRPFQMVDEPDEEWRISFEDLSGVGADRDGAARRLADEHAAAPFDLAQGPLFRCLLIKLDEAEHLLSITMHHIVSDAWSVGLFLAELSELYRAGGDLHEADLPALPVQYRDYAVWQRSWLAGEGLEADLRYWRRELDGAPPALALPTARRRSTSQGSIGGRVRSSIPPEEATALRDLCREHGVTVFMALLAALATVLRRWTGQQDMVIGAPVAIRNDAGTSRLIGFFVNTLPLRVGLSGDPPFTELLRRVRRVALDGYAHSEMPFDLLVHEIQPPRDPTRTPLFQVALNMVDIPEESSQIADLVVRGAESPVLPSKIDLMLNVRESPNGVHFDLAFHGDRYDADMMRTLLRQLGTLLSAVATDPSRGILEYLLQDHEGTPEASEACAGEQAPTPHLAVERHALRSPDRVAVADGTGQWTYRQLSRAADRVAEMLAQRERGQPGRVGVVRRQAAGFVAAILGCVRAGIPFSVVGAAARYPGISTMLDPDQPGTVAHLGDGSCDSAGGPPTGHERGPELADHRRDWGVVQFGLTGHDRFAALSGTSGHIVSALFTALSAGATLFIPDSGTVSLAQWMRSHAVSVAYLSPPLLRAMAAQDPVISLPTLRYAFIDNSGELTYQDISALNQMAASCQCVSFYRTARTGVPLACFAVPRAWSPQSAPLRVPLGTLLPGGQANLVNQAGRQTATGEVGEIRLAEHRTGDLARRLSDGTLEFAGWADATTSAGPPTDPVETIGRLRDMPDVTDAIVTGYLGTDGRPAVAAYVAGRVRSQGMADLRRYLMSELPEYLVPEQFVLLDQLPLTPDGDYDLAALPVPGFGGESADAYVAPRTPMEQRLAAIFEELLDVDRVGVDDTFFELNGFSLLATRLVARIRETFACEVSLREVFEAPTVGGLAQLIVGTQAGLARPEDLEALLAEIE